MSGVTWGIDNSWSQDILIVGVWRARSFCQLFHTTILAAQNREGTKQCLRDHKLVNTPVFIPVRQLSDSAFVARSPRLRGLVHAIRSRVVGRIHHVQLQLS
jgi:hypothetical protein